MMGGRRRTDPLGTRVAVLIPEGTGGVMADDLKQTAKPDDAKINVDQEHEVKHWSEKFGVSREELRRAVQQVGPMVKRVKEHLRLWTKPR
jgi:hypothetical protein